MEIGAKVQLGRDVYVAPTAYVGGNIVLGDNCTVMHHVVIRGDIALIQFGDRCNVQDGAVIHTAYGVPQIFGDEVAIGHAAVVHGKSIGSGTLIGIGAVVLDGSEIGENCLIAAGAVLKPGTKVPSGKVVMGTPARVSRDLKEADRLYIRHVIESYQRVGLAHRDGQFPNVAGSATPGQ